MYKYVVMVKSHKWLIKEASSSFVIAPLFEMVYSSQITYNELGYYETYLNQMIHVTYITVNPLYDVLCYAYNQDIHNYIQNLTLYMYSS